jgi:putative serine protease PepD
VAIFADDKGAPVDPATLRLPYLKLGDVTHVSLNDNITILGFPGVSGSDSITVTSGVVSTFIPDPLHHVDDPRYEMETTARVAHGNSGGAAINPAGELIGVPSLEIPGQGADLSWRLRSVTEAAPLIAAAKAGTPYQSHILVKPGPMRALSAGVGQSRDEACAAVSSIPAIDVDTAYFGVVYAGAPAGVDAAFFVRAPDGAVATTGALQNQSVPGLPEIVLSKPEGCVTLRVSAAQFGRATLLPGTYTLSLLAGPNLDPVGEPATLVIGF